MVKTAVRRSVILAVAVGATLPLAPMAMADAAAQPAPDVTIQASKKKYIDQKKTSGVYGTKATGWVRFHDGWISDSAEWSLTVKDVKADSWCAMVKVIIDQVGNDDEYKSKRVCGKGKTMTFKGKKKARINLHGVKIHFCKIKPVSNAQQPCKRVQYFKSPY